MGAEGKGKEILMIRWLKLNAIWLTRKLLNLYMDTHMNRDAVST